ncbi:Tip attachment protein J [uncultured Caudovirales phage]|uniref:Tip attachment protein J n=1 Tax=uncultured Caudovirales phage TaxID=2100421 RepID=A0A6J5TB03_9CAUD|nr:Tip attachment protein J [uncultured Caudovirales phage]
MKTGFNRFALASLCMYLAMVVPAHALGTIIAGSIAALTATEAAIVAFVINVVVSMVIAKVAASGMDNTFASESNNPGNRQQVPPATDNKLPVVYGSAWLGGTVVDMSMSSDNQWMNFVVALCEVTGSSDEFTFGDIYFGGKACQFDTSNHYKVNTLYDPSSGQADSVAGNLFIYTYKNGSFGNVNSPYSAVEVMFSGGGNAIVLPYKWTYAHAMTNTVFAIVQIKYNQAQQLTSLQQTKFLVNNSRFLPGDCFVDYLSSAVYGASLPLYQIDTDSFATLNAYSSTEFTYFDTFWEDYYSLPYRFRFDGVLDTSRSIMDNIQEMANSCDCLIKFNEVTGKWGAITQTPTYSVAMDINDSNMLGSIQITPTDISSSYNVIEVKFPDSQNQDSFNSVTFSLSQLNPSLLYPNEPINKQSVTLSLVNSDVRAQYIANRLLEAGREDLQITCKVNFTGIQLEAGDVVTMTNTNYGWSAKLFRITKVTEQFGADGAVTADLVLSEYNPAAFDDKDVSSFMPLPNSGIFNPLVFGNLYAPVITGITPVNNVPYFLVNINASSFGVTEYAEVYYSAYNTPSDSQLIFIGTTALPTSGGNYAAGVPMPALMVTSVPAGNWYIFYKYVNSVGKSARSLASSLLAWRPTTFQYATKYLVVAYATNSTGTSGFSFNPRSKTYYGLYATDTIDMSTDPTKYTWYAGSFGTSNYLCFANWAKRSFGFAVAPAALASGAGVFVPTLASVYDPSMWSALQDGVNVIDLDAATGQFIRTGSTTIGTGQLAVDHDPTGKVFVSLQKFLDFGVDGSGNTIYQKTGTVSQLTIDQYGRVVGFESPDDFYMTIQNYTATSGQTVFTTTRASTYISGQCMVFCNGVLLDASEYTDTSGSTGTVTLGSGRATNDKVCIVSYRAMHSTTSYAAFTRNTQTISTTNNTIAPSFTLNDGFEFLFINGLPLMQEDYDIISGQIVNLPNVPTGVLTAIQWVPNNLSTPAGNAVNAEASTIIGQTSYTFGHTADGFNLFQNGVLLTKFATGQTYDWTDVSGGYTLAATPTSNTDILFQQTLARQGAA